MDEKGIDLDLLRQVKEQDRRCLDAYVEARPDATFVPARSVWEVPCEIALPSATQNELTAEAAATMVRHGCVAVGEAANAGGVSTTAACVRPTRAGRRATTSSGPGRGLHPRGRHHPCHVDGWAEGETQPVPHPFG